MLHRRFAVPALLIVAAAGVAACAPSPPAAVSQAAQVGQWIWTRADVALYHESERVVPGLEAGVFVGAVHCDADSRTLHARAGLPAGVTDSGAVTSVIRFEDGLDACRSASDSSRRFNVALDSAVRVLRSRSAQTAVRAVQLDYDAPQRALAAWSASVRALRGGALRGDSVWVTSLIAHLREPSYGALFRDVVDGHVLQVFDTGESASAEQVAEAVRVTRRAGLRFRLGLGAFERETSRGRTEHRAWFGAIPAFAGLPGYAGLWIFPAGNRWVSFYRERV